MTAFVAYRSRAKTVRTIGASLVAIPLLGMMAGGFGSPFDLVLVIAACLALAWNAWRNFGHLGDRAVRFRVDHDGILDRALTDRTIPWTVIRRIRMARWRHHEVVAIDMVEPTFFRADEVSRINLGTIRRKYGADAILTASGLDVSLNEIVVAISRFRPDLIERGERIAI